MTQATTGPTSTAAGGHRPARRVTLGVLALVALLMTLPPVAGAANPSVDQYVESVPTGGDPSGGPSGGGTDGGGSTLPREVRERIRAEGGDDARALEAVASSPSLGAPAPDPVDRGAAKRGRGDTPSKPAPPAGAATAAAVGDGGDGSTIAVLGGGVALLTAIAAGTALARRRS